MERDVSPKLRFSIAPGSSARLSEGSDEKTGLGSSVPIRGGMSARKAEIETRADPQRPYGVSMQARTGKVVTMADLMEAEACAVHLRRRPSPEFTSEAAESEKSRAQESASLPSVSSTRDQSLFSAGDALPSRAGSAGTKGETLTASRSPLQMLRSLFHAHRRRSKTTDERTIATNRTQGEERGNSQ